MRYAESVTVAVMILCGAMALAGCTATALIVVFLVAAIIRGAIEVRSLICTEWR